MTRGMCNLHQRPPEQQQVPPAEVLPPSAEVLPPSAEVLPPSAEVLPSSVVLSIGRAANTVQSSEYSFAFAHSFDRDRSGCKAGLAWLSKASARRSRIRLSGFEFVHTHVTYLLLGMKHYSLSSSDTEQQWQ
jgi:hypothetical protein